LAREHLLRSQQSFTRLDYFGTMGSAQNALAKAAQIADNHFDSVVESMSLDIDEKTTLKAILAQETPRRPQREQAEKWFRLANRIVHNLTTDRGSGSL
jgi:hypothetical protein